MKYENISNKNIRIASSEGLTVVQPGEKVEVDEEISSSNFRIINEKVSTKLSNRKVKEEE